MTAMAARAPPTMWPVAAAAAPVKVEPEALGVTDEALTVELPEPEPETPPEEGAVVTETKEDDATVLEATEPEPEAEADTLPEDEPTPLPAPWEGVRPPEAEAARRLEEAPDEEDEEEAPDADAAALEDEAADEVDEEAAALLDEEIPEQLRS